MLGSWIERWNSAIVLRGLDIDALKGGRWSTQNKFFVLMNMNYEVKDSFKKKNYDFE